MQPETEEVIEIDLFELIETLWDNKLLIVSIPLLCAFIALGVSMSLPPSYESEMVLSLPEAAEEDTYGLNLSEYETLFQSPALMAEVSREAGLEPQDIQDRFQVELYEDSRLLAVKVTAGNPEQAQQLNEIAQESFNQLILSYLETRMEERISAARENTSRRRQELREIQQELTSFDRDYSLAVLSAREENLTERLTQAEAELEELSSIAVPTLQARIMFLEDYLNQQDRFFADEDFLAVFPEFIPEQPDDQFTPLPTGNRFSLVNPNHVYIDRLLTETRLENSGKQERLERLSGRVDELEAELDRVREILVLRQDEREELVRERDWGRENLENARQQRDELINSRSFLRQNSEPGLLSSPTLPDNPVSPRRRLNSAIAFILGLMLVIFYVFFREAWRSREE